MGQLTAAELAKFFREGPVEPMRITGIVETADSRYLGAVGLQKQQPIFNSILGFSWSGILSDSARFYAQPVRAAVEGHDGVVAIFRQFDSSKYQDHPEDILAGWVPPDEAARLEEWVADMNRQLQGLLELKRAAPR
jgi:hypothetical protein